MDLFAVFTLILGLAINDNDAKQDQKIEALENWNLRISGALSALSAREKVNDDLQKRQIDGIKDQLDNAPVAE